MLESRRSWAVCSMNWGELTKRPVLLMREAAVKLERAASVGHGS